MNSPHRIPIIIIVLLYCFVANAQIVNIEKKRRLTTDTVQWFEQLDLGVNIVENTQSIVSINGSAQIEFAFKNKLLLAITDVRFVRAGDTKFVNEGFQHIRYNSIINKRLTYELFGQIQFNELAFIKIRALAGTGLRTEILRNENQNLYIGLSYMYEYDEEKNSDIIHNDNRGNLYLSFNLAPSSIISISGTTYYQPLFTDFKDYRLASVTTLRFTISEKLSFRTSFKYNFDSRVPEGAPRRIYSLSNGLSYQF